MGKTLICHSSLTRVLKGARYARGELRVMSGSAAVARRTCQVPLKADGIAAPHRTGAQCHHSRSCAGLGAANVMPFSDVPGRCPGRGKGARTGTQHTLKYEPNSADKVHASVLAGAR